MESISFILLDGSTAKTFGDVIQFGLSDLLRVSSSDFGALQLGFTDILIQSPIQLFKY
jgi:hypothetical protein